MESMERGHLTAGTVCLLILILVVQASATGVYERAIIPEGDSTYRVSLQFPEGTVSGITETASSGMSYKEISLPPEQYRIEGTTLFLAIIGEREVSYLVTGKPGTPAEITGTYHDMNTGEQGNLPSAKISGSGSVEIIDAAVNTSLSGNDARSRPAPLEPGLLVVALCAAGLLYSIRRRSR